MHFLWWQWTLLALAAGATGLSKTGVPGLGVLAVALFANVLPARESTGALLPLLLCGDVFGILFFRKHADWPRLRRLFPWVAAGVVAGYFLLGHVNDIQVRRIIAVILLAMLLLHWWRKRLADGRADRLPHTVWFAALTGTLAGFSTMMANAAGPLMSLYFLAVGLPKMVFLGTAAWFFMLVNAFKVPFSVRLGLITPPSLLLDAVLVLPMLPGAALGPWLLKRINQRVFEICVELVTLAGIVRLFW